MSDPHIDILLALDREAKRVGQPRVSHNRAAQVALDALKDAGYWLTEPAPAGSKPHPPGTVMYLCAEGETVLDGRVVVLQEAINAIINGQE